MSDHEDADMVDEQQVDADGHQADDQTPPEPRVVPSSVIVYIQGANAQEIPLDGLNKFKDIRAVLIERGVNMDSQVLVDDQDNVKDDETWLSSNVPEAGLAIKTQVTLFIVHDNLEWQVPILLNSKQTVGYVRQVCVSQDDGTHFHNNPSLTWKGTIVPDEMRTDQLEQIQALADPELPEEVRAGLRLFGRKVISIMDIDMGDSHTVELNDVQDFMVFSDVVRAYQTKERRTYLHAPNFVKYVEGETTADSMTIVESLNLESTIYQLNINNADTIALKTAMFEVCLKESKEIEAVQQRNKGVGLTQQKSAADEVPGTKIHVFDHWQVKKLKDTYSTFVTEGLSANDQLFIDSSSAAAGAAYNDDLNEDKTLFHYQIRPESVLLVKREDFTTTYCYYICADCGNDVKLKQRDAVRCRECGHRIVFKRRIPKPCQYLCR